MSEAYRINNQESVYFLTFQIVGWADIFTRQIYRDIVVESLSYCQTNKGLILYGFVIMSNHIHLLAQSKTGNMSGFVRDFKHFTSKKIMENIDSAKESRREWLKMIFEYHGRFKPTQTNQVWTHQNHAEEIYTSKFIEQKLNYIHENPVRAGWVEQAHEYLYSSAKNYAGMSAVLNVTLIK
ncbi:MAG: transposase [Tannerella sp.]|jgi:REP element-mobilizing transposase RayT|nr:transposase [Tannerella sp.]